MSEEFAKPSTTSAADFCKEIDLSDDARALLNDQLSLGDYFSILADHKLYKDAVLFIAHMLPMRHKVWWGCLCAWSEMRPEPTPKEKEAFRAVVNWVLDPNEKHRQTAGPLGKAAGTGTPAGCLALAVFWSEGSMAPPDLPPVASPPNLTPKMVAGAVSMAAKKKPGKSADHYPQFLALAIEVAKQKDPWQTGAKPG